MRRVAAKKESFALLSYMGCLLANRGVKLTARCSCAVDAPLPNIEAHDAANRVGYASASGSTAFELPLLPSAEFRARSLSGFLMAELKWITMPEPVPIKRVNRLVTWILILVNLSVPVFVLFQRKSDHLSDTANTWVGWISAAFVTATLLISNYLRSPAVGRSVPKRMVFIAAGLVFLSGLITTVSISAFPAASLSDGFLQLAQAGIPLSDIQPERKRLVVELIRRDIASTAEDNREAKEAKPISPALYSVDSFATKQVMESTSSGLKQVYKVDRDYAAALHQARQDFHDKMLNVDPGYLRDFEARMHDRDAMDAVILATEDKWATSTLNLYNFAIAHASQISMGKSGHLEIPNPDVQKSLLQQVSNCRTLEQNLHDEREKDANDRQMIQDALRDN